MTFCPSMVEHRTQKCPSFIKVTTYEQKSSQYGAQSQYLWHLPIFLHTEFQCFSQIVPLGFQSVQPGNLVSVIELRFSSVRKAYIPIQMSTLSDFLMS